MATRVLVVEDDHKVRTLIRWRLEAEGYDVDAVGDGAVALAAVEREPPDLIVLDLSLPGPAGPGRARARARDPGDHRVRPHGRGGPDQRARPRRRRLPGQAVLPRRAGRAGALAAAAHRRGGPDRGGCADDRPRARARCCSTATPVELSPKEFDLLAFLAATPGRPFTREQLLQHVWHSSAGWQDPKTVTQHVHRLRHKLEPDRRGRAGCAPSRASATASTRERVDEHQAHLLELMASATPPRRILEELTERLESLMPGARCSILLVEAGTLRHGAAPNLPTAYCAAIDGIAIAAERRLVRHRRVPQRARGRARHADRRALGGLPRARARVRAALVLVEPDHARPTGPCSARSPSTTTSRTSPGRPSWPAGELQRARGDRDPARARGRREAARTGSCCRR